MAQQNAQWISLRSIVSAYLDASEQGIHKEYKCLNLAYRGMETMGIDFFYQIQSLKLQVLPNMTVPLPDNYINYTKVGVLNDVGAVVPLLYNQNITLWDALNPDRIANTEDPTISTFYMVETPNFYNYWNGWGYTNLYGVPSGQPFVGSFKVDNTQNIILLDNNFSFEYIILEYVAMPKTQDEWAVPVQFKDALIAYISWQDIAHLPMGRRGTLGDKRDRQHIFWNERRNAWARYKPTRLDQEYNNHMLSQRLAVKS